MKPERSPGQRDLDWQALIETALTAPGRMGDTYSRFISIQVRDGEQPFCSVEVFERLATAASARFIIPGDEEWPAGLADLRHAESIQRRRGEPVGLWLRGTGHLAHLMELSVAIVGSRAATAYGNGIATDWGPSTEATIHRSAAAAPGRDLRRQPFRTLLRDLQLTSTQVWGLTKTDQECPRTWMPP